ncbi:MAG: hypothetical protein JG782_1565 [Anaerophaga sp.]|uniref:hypothetical protein n=1 Tax=Anaerophaga thermohalophila TaxID=177400 RepID=UPI000237B947|nr:hypothetical protein [Anaerophaga thermohalophila]MBZ4676945.1 hypothetical protein [Anaerophaga sp.]MDI3521743.1 hypothetical protein [Anaerophaga sp.]MDK2842891.1 hypothetical protein [Anaerophaga sp.]
MDSISTMDIDFIISKSLYLQSLLMKLPEPKMKDILVSPRKEFIETLKLRLHKECNRQN